MGKGKGKASGATLDASLLAIEATKPSLPVTPAEFKLLRSFFPDSLSISNPAARSDLRGFYVKLLTRLRASTYALARDMKKIMRIPEAERYPQEKQKLAEQQQALDNSREFLQWIYELIRKTLHPGASYQASITALSFLDLLLESGVDARFGQTQQSSGSSQTASGSQSTTPEQVSRPQGDSSKSLSKNAGMSLAKSKQVFVQEFPFSLNIISPSLVRLLLSCSESRFDDIQSRALTILARFPAPLQGFESPDSASQRILGRAAELLTSTRDFECASASRLVQLYREIYMQQLGHRPKSLLVLVGATNSTVSDPTRECAHPILALIFSLLDFLSHHLRVAEAGNLLEAANNNPLHGTLITLQELFGTIDLHRMGREDRLSYKAAVEDAEKLIDRTWEVTRSVLCNSAPEGSAGGDAEESATDGTTGLDQPTHETARAMRLADDEGKAELMQPQEESNAGPKHQVILSYSWRGMKEASALLGALVAVTLAPPVLSKKEKAAAARAKAEADVNGNDAGQIDEAAPWREVFSLKAIENVGARFNLWLTQVRHRGAFSTIYPAYCNAASAIVGSEASDIKTLPQQWIASFLDAVAQPGSQLSITRRSAGIGYAVLALVSAQPNKFDAMVLGITVNRLISISNDTSLDADSMPVASIHALNILRVLVMDGGLADFMAPYLGTLLELTVSKFKSRYWGLRNVSMMLFSSLCIRIFGSRNTNKDTKESRMSVHEFFATYPNADGFLRRVLEQELQSERKDGGQEEEGGESSVFAILMLFSRLQAPNTWPESHTEQERMHAFSALLRGCLASKVWKIREIGAKALSAFVPLSDAIRQATHILVEVRDGQLKANEQHGRLMAAQRLVKGARDIEGPVAALTEDLAELRSALDSWLARSGRPMQDIPVVQAALLEALQDIVSIERFTSVNAEEWPIASAEWISWAQATINEYETRVQVSQSYLQTPGRPALLGTCGRFLLQQAFPDRNSSAVPRFLKLCNGLLQSSSAEVRMAVLEAMTWDDAEAALPQVAAAAPTEVLPLAHRLHNLVLDESEGIWHRVHAAEVLHLLSQQHDASGRPLLACLTQSVAEGGMDLYAESKKIVDLTRCSFCVPLREALLPYLADLCNLLLHDQSAVADRVASTRILESWADIVAKCADEYQSVQSREAAGQAMRALGSVLFPHQAEGLGANRASLPLFRARVAAIDLLTDDDEDVRIEATAMICETIGRPMATEDGGGSVSFDAATDVAWSWMRDFYSENATSENDADVWTGYVWSHLVPAQAGLDREFAELTPNTVLFIEEKPNQFRDPENRIRRAARFARTTTLSAEASTEILGRAIDNLLRLKNLLDGHARFDASTAHLLATHLILGLHGVIAAGDKKTFRSSAKQQAGLLEATAAAVVIAQRLGIEMPDLDIATNASPLPPSDQGLTSQGPRYSIAMVSDFFYPNVGGVEGHIFFVGERLLALGHKVIVITHAYAPHRVGVRYLSNGLKVYYVPYQVIARQDTLPNFFSLFPTLRSILIREQIEIVHGHQALSSMAHEGILHARTMGLRTVFTDHSLFGFSDTASILTNKLFKLALSDIDRVVCVSHTGKENTVLRANLDPSKVSVIPNAVVADQFLPDPGRASEKLTVVVLSRLMYRKGIDLLIAAIPRICATHPDIHFLIGGDGPKRIELEQMRERHLLQDRVELCGAVRQGNVQAHLTRGSIFLNTSLTEAFGTGIIEAACAGLFVVSTKVGGTPEVLPPSMIRLARPEEDDVVRAMEDAIEYVRAGKHDPIAYHEMVKSMYSWADIAERLEEIYKSTFEAPFPRPTERFHRYYQGGPIAGKIFVIIVAVDLLFLKLLQWLLPDDAIDRSPTFSPPYLSHPRASRSTKGNAATNLAFLIPDEEAAELKQSLSQALKS
ncbi:hypothetical protein BCV70DRAFT_200757 [Testicularia cyperi]|uniref:phosphatidylinositol N-acetylglucosaminyltransferase n=1 Tax=Testicularia cyperi TaxID=1882483 RepID=A0A317XPX4_9BASI|nr:hypothetical protein BCV70DRAFT_200757 [Testicularia cyperi]